MLKMTENLPSNLLIIILWAVLVVTVDWVRPLFYSNEEMHYASIAWEMWQHHHFILPIQSGEPYSDKGPLLFWLYHLGWGVFGVSNWWVRLVPALFGLMCLLLIRKLVLQLWPGEKSIAAIAPLILLGSFFFAAKIPVARYDIIVTFLILCTLYQLITAIEVSKKYWWLFSLSLALGLLAKGPVVFLFVAPAIITVYWWATPNYSWRSVWVWMTAGTLFGIVLACGWLVPAIIQSGSQYAHALLFDKSMGRIWHGQGFTHAYYLYITAMMLLPWLIWPPFWQALWQFFKDIRANGLDKKLRLLLIIISSAFIILTIVEDKAPRYILPALPVMVIFISYLLIKYPPKINRTDQWLIACCYLVVGIGYATVAMWSPLKIQHKYPWLMDISSVWGYCLAAVGLFWLLWREDNLKRLVTGLTISTIVFWSCYHLGVTKAQAYYGDWRRLGRQLASLELSGHPVAAVGPYQQLEFFGRLPQPVTLLFQEQIPAWSKQHPDGWIVVKDHEISPMQLKLTPAQQYL